MALARSRVPTPPRLQQTHPVPHTPQPPTPRRRRHGRGFSLVEILVVITLVGIAAALSIPRASRVINQTKVQRAAQALQAEVQQAFALAARNRAPVQIRWSSSTMQLRVTNLAGTTIYRRLGVGSGGGYGLTSSEVTVSPTSLTVFPNGLAADTLIINVARSAYSRRYWVSRSGIVKLK
jgi:prepilin-type N-terminal cleavage/methylation domain-containing protein